MLNDERSHPEYFHELCALAASGQISEAEFAELEDHVQQCAGCRSAYEEFVDLVHRKLPLADPQLNSSVRLAGTLSETSYRDRFLARARKEGIRIPNASPGESRRRVRFWPVINYAQFATAAMAVLLVTAGILGYSLRQSDDRYRTLAAETLPRTPSLPVALPTPPRLAVASPSTPVYRPEPAPEPPDRSEAEAHARALEQQLQSAALEVKAAKTERDDASDSRIQIERKLTDAEQALTRASQELERARQGRSEDAATLSAQNREIRELSSKLNAQTESLERERTLLAAGRDIHDLMGARNLHVVDVLDVDSKGKDKRAFGRVFYTEGKSLIFYAFDLGERGTQKRNASFQVWGAQGPAQGRAQNLGIFYVDDQKQQRWVLKFEDPRVLAEIDSVFVTIEPPGGSARPTGRKFLYAYLKANANHP